MRLSNLLSALPHSLARTGAADPEISLVTADSRRVIPGALFVAVRGERFDGHRFIADALARGAAAVIAEEPHSHPSTLTYILLPDSRLALAHLAAAWHGFPARRLVMIGVTGTDGKTTTCTLIHSVLTAAGLKAGLISTVGATLGQETLDTGFHVTTPEAMDVQAYLARMVATGLTHCVLEVTSHGLAQHRVAGCEFDVAVITNITHEHLDYHKTFDDYRAAKSMLFEGLVSAAAKPGVEKAGILNLDDSSFDYLQSVLKAGPVTYSTRSALADVRATNIVNTAHSMQFQSLIRNSQFPVTTFLLGEYNLSNCLAAIAATVCALHVAPEAAQHGITAVKGVPGRMERVDMGQPFTAIVDFAHTPNALRRALETARQMLTAKDVESNEKIAPLANIAVNKVIAVFGSAGLRDVEKRRMMAEVSAELADMTILTAEDPRTESLDDILEMMAFGMRSKGGVEGQTFFRAPDRGEALRLAVRLARPGDIVIACGKGHEQSMCFGETEYAWDDRTALRAALAERLGVSGPPMPRLPTG
jgi:UDP-N-acetylmuramoyl-L-alanyl-D-glutamate--2,6-diaminopimelate ligase